MSTEKHTTPIEYREIPEAEGYQFGSDGTIRSCWHAGGNDRTAKTDPARWHAVKPSLGKRGYYRANIRIDGKLKPVYFHTMILTAFRGHCPAGMECRHLDGNPLNNQVDNLAWGTPTDNVADQFRHGTHCVGERRNSAKFTPDKVRTIRSRHATGERITALAREYKVNHNAIRCIVVRKTWKHVL